MPTYRPFVGRGVRRRNCVLFIVFYLRPAFVVGGLLGVRRRWVCPNIWYHELGWLRCGSRAGGMPAITAFAGGCAKLRAVCRPMEVRGGVAVTADAKAAPGESATSAVNMGACGERVTTATRGESAAVVTGVSAPGRVRGGDDRR